MDRKEKMLETIWKWGLVTCGQMKLPLPEWTTAKIIDYANKRNTGYKYFLHRRKGDYVDVILIRDV